MTHRDIKPANILMTRDGRTKIADFGIARLDHVMLTQYVAMIGTPSYMAPEQAGGQPIDHRADLFATGAILFEMLAGKPPFQGSTLAETPGQSARPGAGIAGGDPAGAGTGPGPRPGQGAGRPVPIGRRIRGSLARGRSRESRQRRDDRRGAEARPAGGVADRLDRRGALGRRISQDPGRPPCRPSRADRHGPGP
ncbi:MAG: protein kinase [Aliidongia sp.]